MKFEYKKTFKNIASEMSAKMQFLRFLLVGGINTLFGYSCYALFIYLGFGYPVAMLFATILGVMFNFVTTGAMVFQQARIVFFPKFVMGYAFNYFVSVFFIWALKFVMPNDYLAGLVIVLPMAIISFLLNRYLVFRERI